MTSSLPHKSSKPTRLVVGNRDRVTGPAYDLAAGHVTTIGRLPVNDIVIDDDLCSRQHCEVFRDGDAWTLRDLNSRNGTFLDERPVTRDVVLKHGQIIRIGATVLHFCINHEPVVSQFDTEIRLPVPPGSRPRQEDTPHGSDSTAEFENDAAFESDSNILHRAKESRYSVRTLSEQRSQELARGISHLYQMAIRTAACKDLRELADTTLDALFGALNADIGAVLMFKGGSTAREEAHRFQRIAFRSRVDIEYEQVSETLTRETLAQGEALLAEDWRSEQPWTRPKSESLDEMEVRSVICAPIRRNGRTCGLIHLYTTQVDSRLDEDDLHLTLAVADHCATVMDSLEERTKLHRSLRRAQSVNDSLRQQLEQENQLVGESPSLQRLRSQARRVGPTDAIVLIRGESGVGKELVARMIHTSSTRQDKPLVCMNCAALTESLLESELFGHEKGAFTGATEKKLGKFEQADQGTLFLDEVGEMSWAIQSKFLRVLEGHPFERVGGNHPIKVDVRVLAATNRNLEQAVKQGAFRQDLYFRLQVVQIGIDPLRERRGDIPALAEHFLKRFADKTGRHLRGITPAAMERLIGYHWPGNVRELQNTIERAVILCQTDTIDACDIQLSTLEGDHVPALRSLMDEEGHFREITIEELEQAHILATLTHTDWNKTRAAEILGIERSTLDRKLKRYNVSRPAAARTS